MKRNYIFLVLILCINLASGFGQVDSQWRGPNRDGVYPNEKLLKKWPDGGLEFLWKADGLGKGYSSVAVTEDRIYVTGMTDGKGNLYAFDTSGRLVWKSSYGPEWDGSRPGARTTPTVVGDKIYLMSAEGHAVCMGKDGKMIWSVDLMKNFGARNLQWGMTESPLVDGNRVYLTPGGPNVMMVALDRNTGDVLWKIKGNGETSGYCSPCLVKYGSKRLILTMTAKSVVGLDADTGEYLWRYPHVTSYVVNANTPLYHEGYIFTDSGYGTGGQMFKFSEDGKTIDRIWAEDTLDSQMGSVILVDGYIYGSGHNNRGWHCLDWKTGEVKFSERVIGNKGNIIYSDGMLYCYSERGDIALVKPNPEKFEVMSSFRLREGTGEHWAHPVIKEGRLFVRHGDVLMVYNIAR